MKKEKLGKIVVHGKISRTNNHSLDFFGEKWKDFYEHNDPSKETVYAVYTNYESDYKGDFDFLVGVETDNGAPAFEIPAAEYYVWDTGSADPAVLPIEWTKIWASGINRKYTTDFELFKPGETIKIYLAV
ncbi:putative transcriptional regulator YdeE [Parelusimicrobium proximum]|uniref:GyrI-like domain-containing protein n=1 Tax=Parelusimicrobium proximum TaxID=3228953 RepID=UPI003D175770